MPYSDPTDPQYTTYALNFRDAVSTQSAEYRTYFHVTLDLASAPEEDTRAAYQRLLDLIDASPAFDRVTATRSGHVTQYVTPTEAPT